MTIDIGREALRQQMLLRALWRDARPGVVEGWLRDAPQRKTRGLQAYQANAGALAERALAAAFPTIVALVGAESFAALARAFWQAQPPAQGDIAQWGAGLPDFIAAADSLADETYLADSARLDWAVHTAEAAADAEGPVQDLDALGRHEPAGLWLRLRAGTALLESDHPVASIWLAHRRDDEDRFAPVREAFAAGRGETALVWRAGFKAHVAVHAPAQRAFTAAVLRAEALGTALERAGDSFDFEHWLVTALQQGWLAAVQTTPWRPL